MENCGNETILSEDLFLQIQSVVISVHAQDFDSLKSLEDDLFSELDKDQIELLHLILTTNGL